jgi:hypothetical protein
MRKRFWTGVALMVCTAAGVWLYARRASEETLIACAVKPVGQTAAAEIAPTPAVVGSGASHPVFEPLPTAADVETIEPIIVEAREEPRVSPPFRIGGILNSGEEEICEPIISTPLEAPPAYMPYADEPLGSTPLVGAAIASESTACPGSWGWLCSQEEAPSCPCTCTCTCGAWIMDLVNKFASVLCPPAPVEGPPPPDGEAQEPPMDLRERLGLPSLREDPNYHYHYPSCPYPGNCPYPYHYQLPPVQPVRPMLPQRESPPAPKRGEPHRQISYFTPDMESAGVDTMECRPSDLPHLGRNRPF